MSGREGADSWQCLQTSLVESLSPVSHLSGATCRSPRISPQQNTTHQVSVAHDPSLAAQGKRRTSHSVVLVSSPVSPYGRGQWRTARLRGLAPFCVLVSLQFRCGSGHSPDALRGVRSVLSHKTFARQLSQVASTSTY